VNTDTGLLEICNRQENEALFLKSEIFIRKHEYFNNPFTINAEVSLAIQTHH